MPGRPVLAFLLFTGILRIGGMSVVENALAVPTNSPIDSTQMPKATENFFMLDPSIGVLGVSVAVHSSDWSARPRSA